MEKLVDSRDLDSIIDDFHNLVINASDPERAKDLEKADIVDFANSTLGLLASIAEIYRSHEDLRQYERIKEAC